MKQTLWDMFEYPDSSVAALIIGSISFLCVMLTIIDLSIEDLPFFKEKNNKILNVYAPLFVVDAICNAFFTLELIIRFMTCPRKKTFIQVLNWIDFFVTEKLLVYKLRFAFKDV